MLKVQKVWESVPKPEKEGGGGSGVCKRLS